MWSKLGGQDKRTGEKGEGDERGRVGEGVELEERSRWGGRGGGGRERWEGEKVRREKEVGGRVGGEGE